MKKIKKYFSFQKLILLFLIIFITFSFVLISQEEDIELSDSTSSDVIDAKDYKFRFVKNEAFGFGENLEYNVGYKFIVAGTGYLKIDKNPVIKSGRKSYVVKFEVKSLESLDFLYKVRDAFISIIDIGGIFSWEFRQKVREGNYKRDSRAEFDQVNHKAYVKKNIYDIPEYVHDIISAFYYVRTLELNKFKNGHVLYLKNFFKDTTYTLGVKVHGKQTCEVEAGKFNCILIEPLVNQGGLFQSDGSIYIWLTDDDRKMPVKVATKIPIGFVEARLTSYRGLRGPLNSKIKAN
ncbi:MAG: hypothetical protein A2X64_02575 [Ignavibacteria bacterium GWF2_33_9]|nr:MAG: hypothetical protein A2X64_02575 [Ignavibacteria bacterium GWF2_33_9]